VWEPAALALGAAFSQIPNKDLAWKDLHRLTTAKYSVVRANATIALGEAFSQIPNKDLAWEDLRRLTTDEDGEVRRWAACTLGAVFSQIPNKDLAWKDLHRLTTDEDDKVRSSAVYALGAVFPQIPDKNLVGDYLHKLATDESRRVQCSAAYALGQAFPQIPDKNRALEDLHRLSTDDDSSVRSGTASALGQAFPQIPDKNRALEDLHRLSTDDDSFVRSSAASALGQAFSQIPDKNRAWNDLHRLSTDDDSFARVSANHSLGRASIFKATEAEYEEDFRKELENALEFFGRSAGEATYSNPSKFCLPFYRSFYVLTFKKQDAEIEVQKYLAEAKSASEGSKSKEKLLEAIENLSNALKEARNQSETYLEAKKRDLNACRLYCDRAAQLLAETREDAPGATRLIEKGLPIIDHRIRETLAEIREKTNAVCKQTLDTPAEEFGKEIARQGKALCQVRDPIQLEKALINLDRTLSSQVKDPEIQELITQARSEPNVEDRLNLYNIIFGIILGKSHGATSGLVETINIQNVNVPAEKDEESKYKHLKPFLEIVGLIVAIIAVLIAAFEAGIL